MGVDPGPAPVGKVTQRGQGANQVEATVRGLELFTDGLQND